jgi:hypothetical protein
MTTNKINWELSKKIAGQIDPTNKHCYHNAYMAIFALRGAEYIEGYIVPPDGLVTEHGWLEFEGQIIEPTPAFWEEGIAYFAGLRFKDGWEVAKAMVDGNLPIFYNLGWGGRESPEMMTACKAAWQHVGIDITEMKFGVLDQ